MDNKRTSLDTLCSSLCYAAGVKAPSKSAAKNELLSSYIDERLGGEKADRIIMYNPDAIAQWVYEKYPFLVREVKNTAELCVPFETVMPSVTPVCFGTMYTGVQPSVHGIRAYEKPVISIETVFDVFIKAGKKCAIVSTSNDSMSKIFLERNMDYFIYDTIEEVNAKAVEVVLEDKYDLLCIYNGNYDTVMHKYGPESIEALSELRCNSQFFALLDSLVRKNYTNHNTLLGFAMDHGCHEIDGGCGSHGLDMREDLDIIHFYKVYKNLLFLSEKK